MFWFYKIEGWGVEGFWSVSRSVEILERVVFDWGGDRDEWYR